MATITDDTDRVHLTEGRRARPGTLAQKLGYSFEEYGFAIIADHGIPGRTHSSSRGEGKGIFCAARRGEAKISHCRQGRSAGLHALRDRDGERPQGARPQGILAHRPRPCPRAQFRDHMPDNPLALGGAGLQGDFPRALRDLRSDGSYGPRAIARYLGIERNILRMRFGTAIRCFERSTTRPRRSPPGNIFAQAPTRTSTRSRFSLGAEEAGLELLTRMEGGCRSHPKPGRTRDQHWRLAPAAYQRPAALDVTPGRQPRPRPARATRATRCLFSCISVRIS